MFWVVDSYLYYILYIGKISEYLYQYLKNFGTHFFISRNLKKIYFKIDSWRLGYFVTYSLSWKRNMFEKKKHFREKEIIFLIKIISFN